MKIYVGNLSWSMSEEDLTNLFGPYGEVVSAKIMVDAAKGNRSKGFGFVEMSNDEEAQQAIAQLNDSDQGGRKIIVNESRPQDQGGQRPFGGGQGGGNESGGYRRS